MAGRVRARIARFAAHLAGPTEAARGLERVVDVTAYSDQIDLDALKVVGAAPCWMTRAERLLLYALVFGLRPRRYLEIGTMHGGSALITATAMAASGSDGRIVCLDPEPQLVPDLWARIEARATLVRSSSPQGIPEARAAAGGPFDLVLIDGDHTAAGVRRDLSAVVDHVEHGGHIVCHDAYNAAVGGALSDWIARNHGRVTDIGVLTREVTFGAGEPAPRWGGIRLLRLSGRAF